MIRGIGSIALLLIAGSLAKGENQEPAKAKADGPPAPAVPAVKLTLHPGKAPVPVLKYRLLPELKDRTPGNAALLYQRAHSPEWLTHRRQPDYNQMTEWLNVPLKELQRDKLKWLLRYGPLQEIDLAARREQCDWEMTWHLRNEGFMTLMPDIQGFRDFATLLALRARLEMAEGKSDKAIHTFQTGFSLARDLGRGPTLINALVGIAVGHNMVRQVETFIQMPEAPNMYWALTTLPRPLVGLRKGIEGEKLMVLAEFPDMEKIEKQPLSQDQLVAMAETMAGYRFPGTVKSLAPAWEKRAAITALALKMYPQAKRALIAQGRSRKEVEALPVLQVVLIDAFRKFRRIQDDIFKWDFVPYWQAREGIARTGVEARKARESLFVFPHFLDFLPSMQRLYFSPVRLDRKIAALRCVEAIRLYAASHAGKLPRALKDIDEVPIPLDPATGNDFEYKTDGNKAVVSAPPPGGKQRIADDALRYEVTITK
jgi:hypothetical protein